MLLIAGIKVAQLAIYAIALAMEKPKNRLTLSINQFSLAAQPYPFRTCFQTLYTGSNRIAGR